MTARQNQGQTIATASLVSQIYGHLLSMGAYSIPYPTN